MGSSERLCVWRLPTARLTVAVIATTLAYEGAEFDRSRFIRIGDTNHHSCHFEVVVGRARAPAKARATSLKRIFKRAEAIRMTASSTLPFPTGANLKIPYGTLSSREGLVYVIRDGAEGKDGESDDESMKDKRLLVVEQELGAALRAFQRPANKLSMILRMAMTAARSRR
jgi:hypothetical protein